LINHADEARRRKRRVETSMMLAEVPDADDPCPQRCHWLMILRAGEAV
jgi:hypothetical protein